MFEYDEIGGPESLGPVTAEPELIPYGTQLGRLPINRSRPVSWSRSTFFFEDNPLAMWVYDRETRRILAANKSCQQQYGYSEDELLGLLVDEIVEARNIAGRIDPAEGLDGAREWIERHSRKDGTSLHVEVFERDLTAGDAHARVVVARELTEDKQERMRLRTLALQDPLTGLANRSSLDERGEQALRAARRSGHKMAILCVDLDRFKQINDWYGHATGDECLREAGNRLTRRLRGMDVVARVGGEEFTVVLAEVESVASAMVVANFLLQAIGKPFEVDNHTVTMRASIGLAVYPDHGTEVDELCRTADAAMYKAKRAGGNQAALAQEEPPAPTAKAFHMEAYLRSALAEGGFRQHYQLQYRPDGRIRGMEALLRLPHEEVGFISPDRFIPVAEETGLIYPIGYWVLGQACQRLRLWNVAGREPMRIAVNVSPLQLLRPDFAASVMNVVRAWGVDPEWLELEITERMILNFDEVEKGMRLLDAQGVHFAVDDFGTGYSSLQHLNRLPISTVKIDRSFVQRLCEPNGSYPIVEAIVAMGHSLKMEVIAEGVEEEEQRLALEQLGVDAMQGFLLARPAPIEKIGEVLGMDPAPDVERPSPL